MWCQCFAQRPISTALGVIVTERGGPPRVDRRVDGARVDPEFSGQHREKSTLPFVVERRIGVGHGGSFCPLGHRVVELQQIDDDLAEPAFVALGQRGGDVEHAATAPSP